MGTLFGIALNASAVGIPDKYAKPIAGIAAIAWATAQKDKDVTGNGSNSTREEKP